MAIKVTVNLPEEAVELIDEYAEKRGISKTEALRRLLAHEKYLLDAVEDEGKVLIETRDRSLREVVFA